jgi:outer membrane protein assembly factor BamB
MRRIALLSVLPVALLAQAAPPPETGAAPAPAQAPAAAQILDGRTAASLGLKHAWQVGLPRDPRAAWGGLSITPSTEAQPASPVSEVVVWDGSGVVLCVDGLSGKLRWQNQPTSSAQRYESVTRSMIEGRDLLLALGDHRLVALDRNTGEVMGVSAYRHNPSTGAVSMGNMLAFGAKGRNLSLLRVFEEDIPRYAPEKVAPGRIQGLPKTTVSRREVMCTEIRSIGLKGKPAAAPVVLGQGLVLQTSEDGEICVLNPATGVKSWRLELPGRIRTAGAVTEDAALVGADDQYLRCLDLGTGRVRWKWFALAPLHRPILATPEFVMTQVPGTGLVALRTRLEGQDQQSHLDGEVLWKNEAVIGDPVMRVRSGVLVWDASARSLSLVDTANGKVRETVSLPGVRSVTASAPTDGDLILLQDDGRMQRCSPLDPLPKPASRTRGTESAGDEAAAPDAASEEAPASAPAEAPAESTEPGR